MLGICILFAPVDTITGLAAKWHWTRNRHDLRRLFSAQSPGHTFRRNSYSSLSAASFEWTSHLCTMCLCAWHQNASQTGRANFKARKMMKTIGALLALVIGATKLGSNVFKMAACECLSMPGGPGRWEFMTKLVVLSDYYYSIPLLYQYKHEL